ncbi:MAG: coenzyme F420-0:L-glutamate ligase [Alphaproteobacteria bacterium]|nr:coenzyme F420-0:L-glutamate ligase [Alphaproteobacteria bacterium]
MAPTLTYHTLAGFPRVQPGDDLARQIADCLAANRLALQPGDVVALAQKVVSKAEGRYRRLDAVTPGAAAEDWARRTGKDPRLVQVTLDESNHVLRYRDNLLVVEQRLGMVMANAGIDQSNVEQPDGDEQVLLLPEDPDGWCGETRERIGRHFGVDIAVVLSDSFGRAWRVGTTGVAIGAAGLPAVLDCVGAPDLFGRALRVTQIGFADEVAAAASLIMGQAAEGRPAVLVRGLEWRQPALPAGALVRPREEDMFRTAKS